MHTSAHIEKLRHLSLTMTTLVITAQIDTVMMPQQHTCLTTTGQQWMVLGWMWAPQ